jgi:DNA mismatch endonuclease, patch repair protein
MKPRSQETISYTMSRIRGKDTGIEKELRKELTRRGLRYRCNSKFVFGHPDVSFKGYKVAIFCDSEFWHGYHFAENKGKLHSHQDYWIRKIERNIKRDQEVNEKLAQDGFAVLRFWGKELDENAAGCADEVVALLAARGYRTKKASS